MVYLTVSHILSLNDDLGFLHEQCQSVKPFRFVGVPKLTDENLLRWKLKIAANNHDFSQIHLA